MRRFIKKQCFCRASWNMFFVSVPRIKSWFSMVSTQFPFLHLPRQVEGIQITGFPTVILFPAGKSPKRRVWKTQEGNHYDYSKLWFAIVGHGIFMRFFAVKRVDIFLRRLDEQVGLAESVLINRTLSRYATWPWQQKTLWNVPCVIRPAWIVICAHHVPHHVRRHWRQLNFWGLLSWQSRAWWHDCLATWRMHY